MAVLLLALQGQAWAHEGHHHDEPEPQQAAPAAPTAPGTPRIEAVAQREGGDVVLYLDDYASNTPLDGLEVSVRSGGLTLQAAGGEGRYRIPADLLLDQGGQALEVSVHGRGLDTPLRLDLPAAAPALPVSAPATALWPRLASVLLILGVLLAAWLLRRRRGAGAARDAQTA